VDDAITSKSNANLELIVREEVNKALRTTNNTLNEVKIER